MFFSVVRNIRTPKDKVYILIGDHLDKERAVLVTLTVISSVVSLNIAPGVYIFSK